MPGTGSQCAAGSQCACCGPRAPVVKWLARSFPASARVHGSGARVPCIARAPCARPHAACAMLAAAGRTVAAGPRSGRPGAAARGGPAAAGARTPPERALSGARPRRRRRRRSWSGWSTRHTARRSAWRAPAGRASAGSARRAAPRRPRDPRPPALSRRPQALQSAPARSRAVGRTCAAATPVRAARRRAACCLGTELRLRMAGRLLQGGCDHAPRAAGP